MILRLDAACAAAILFLNAWNFGLPVSDRVPVWAVPIQIIRGIFLYEALIVAYIALAFFVRVGYLRVPTGRELRMALLIASLTVVGILSIVANNRPAKEVGTVSRYFVFAAYFLCVVAWGKAHGPKFVLRSFLGGIAAGGFVNLCFTYTRSERSLAGLPMLLGQNGPGGYLAVGVILGAWLMTVRERKTDVVLALSTATVGLSACAISYSKLAMLIAFCGACAWVLVLWQDFNTPRMRKWYIVVAVALGAALWVHRDLVADYLNGVSTFVQYKFRWVDPDSIRVRSLFFRVTAEILLGHPVLGVGPGGFYDAAAATNAYRNMGALAPDLGIRGVSHPESSFLYYAVGFGTVGLFVVLVLFVKSLGVLWSSLRRRRLAGRAVWLSAAAGFTIFGLTLPTLFSATVLYVPVAIALSDSELLYTRRGQMQ